MRASPPVKKGMALWALAALLAAALSGCGGRETAATPPATPAPTEAAVTAQAPPEPPPQPTPAPTLAPTPEPTPTPAPTPETRTASVDLGKLGGDWPELRVDVAGVEELYEWKNPVYGPYTLRFYWAGEETPFQTMTLDATLLFESIGNGYAFTKEDFTYDGVDELLVYMAKGGPRGIVTWRVLRLNPDTGLFEDVLTRAQWQDYFMVPEKRVFYGVSSGRGYWNYEVRQWDGEKIRAARWVERNIHYADGVVTFDDKPYDAPLCRAVVRDIDAGGSPLPPIEHIYRPDNAAEDWDHSEDYQHWWQTVLLGGF